MSFVDNGQTPAPDQPPAQQPADDGDNPFLQRLQADPSVGQVSLWDRFNLNGLQAAHHGTLMGAGSNAFMSEMLQNGGYGPDNAKAAASILNQRNDEAVRYQNMPSWNGPLEGLVSFAGQMVGGMTSPEALISRVPGLSRLFAPVASNVIGRTAEAAVSQGVVNTAVDPLVQGMNIKSGLQKDFDWQQFAMAFPSGAALGGMLHGIGETVNAAAARWFASRPEAGARVQVNDFNPATGPGPLHGEQGSVVGPSQAMPEHLDVQMDSGQKVTLDPRILENPEIPQAPETVPQEAGKPDFPKDGVAKSAETVAADHIADQISEPAPRTPDEMTARLERDADISAQTVPKAEAEPELQFRSRVAGSQPPAAPGGSPAGSAPDAVTSLHEQAMNLADTLEMPLRQGRVRGGKNALGQFDVRQGVA